ncbi:membrane protein insertase YidC [Tautonia sociabilis]|uniref:Membrane protein insertase YidC n=1 Tax=Tautonia sociabilis TaxID=2080755 RepID=A0A432MDR9_9BACT|nr:YidC/Oxa1 family insertase periplasmic-domain containing protein [Tautonia sociabilis]RUL83085.1 membrane protein insertase YidC [Tautonia sociabilis]
MSTEPPPSQDPKRLMLFMILSLALITGTNLLLSRFGLLPEPEAPQEERILQADADADGEEAGTDDGAPGTGPADAPLDGEDAPVLASGTDAGDAVAAPPAEPDAERVNPALLVLGGSAAGQGEDGYHLEVVADQHGASISRITSTQYNAEYEDNKPRRRPLTLVSLPPHLATIDDPESYRLRLLLGLQEADAMPKQGERLVVVADVLGVLHVRIFDDEGRRVVDADERQFAAKPTQLARLKLLVATQRGAESLSKTIEDRIVSQAITLVAPEHRPLAIQVVDEDEDGRLMPVSNLESRLWQVLVDGVPFDELGEEEKARARPVAIVRDEQGTEVAQELRFRTTLREPSDLPPVTITKTFRLRKGADAVEVLLDFALPEGADQDRSVIYRIDGPSGLPIEGEWYTHTFRNVYFGKGEGKDAEVYTYSSYDVASDPDGPDYVNNARPTAFAGQENQYFATFLKPANPSVQVAEASMTVVDADSRELKKADVSVDLVSKPIELAPGDHVAHAYTLFAGPKTDAALGPYDAEGLAIYRQVGRIPVIGFLFDALWAIVDPIVALLSVYVIGPLLENIYAMTVAISGWFGGTRGSYGIAIILLTIVVRMALFPLSRKQAASAKKMQDLQPQMAELRKKYPTEGVDPQKRQENQQKIAQETFALYRKHGVNPLGGCLPVFVQIPIFMTLWRVLNVSVSLRQAQFLWIDNLAAPDMLVRFPFEIPLLGPYFNLLPLGVIALFFLQMKLFTPPATTPEQEAQQRIMKFMMIFMMLMFYRVPAGLALYFITSSIWSIGERLLLPKLSKSPAPGAGPGGTGDDGPDGKGPSSGGGAPRGGWLSRKLDELMKEAAKETTYRREELERRRRELETGASSAPSDRDRDRSRPKRKTKPGKRR